MITEDFLAGGEGIEPSQAVLETAVLPLYEPPIEKPSQMVSIQGLLGFFVQSFFLVELTILH